MFLTKIAIKRPISVIMIYLAILVIAAYAIMHIPLSLMPNLSYPKLNISAYWQDASPEEVEANVTSQLEAIGSTIPGIINVSSTSYRQSSRVELKFDRNIDMDFARFELNEKLQLLQDKLPDGVTPRIQAFVPREFRESEFLQYGISGPYEPNEMKKLINRYLKYQLSAVDGVSAVDINGVNERQINIILHDSELNHVNSNDIKQKLQDSGSKVSFSGLDELGQSYQVQLKDNFENIRELEDIIINRYDGSRVRLADISTIKWEFDTANSIMRYNGLPQITLTIGREETTNSIQLAKQLKKIMKERGSLLPEDIEIIKLEDESEAITTDLNMLYARGFISIFIIFIVLLIFLRHAQSTILVLITIFFSSALTFIFMYYLGIGLNMLSLAGLALGFGMMVDNSIVVYENIFRFQHHGVKPHQAAILGVNEVALPITASTLTTIIVFAPFLYMQGDLKIFYLPFVYSMVLSLLSSLFVSFTFIPLASIKFLKIKSANYLPEEELKFNPELTWFQKVVKFLLRWRWIWVALVIGFLGYSTWIFVEKVDKGFTFNLGKDDYLQIQISMPLGSNIDQTNDIVKMFEKKIVENEHVLSTKTKVYTSYGYMRVDFSEEEKKTANPLVMREKLKAYATNFGGVRVWVIGFGPSFGGGGGTTSNFSVTLQGYNYSDLKQLSEELAGFLQQANKRVQNMDTNSSGWWKSDRLFEYQIMFDRDKLAVFQTDIATIIGQVYQKLKTQQGGFEHKIGKEEFTILVKDEGHAEFSIEDLRELVVMNRAGAQLKLSEVATILKQEILPEIIREDELYTRMVKFDYRGSYKKGKRFVDGMKEVFPLPIGYTFAKERNYNFDSDDDKKQMMYLLLFAVILVYMSLASLFESFRYPFIILLTLPLAFIGVAFAFYFADETFAEAARIGLVLLAGIVVNNSIIMVFHINQLRDHGIELKSAILQSVRDRTRPILMTSLTTVMALVPMLVKVEAGKNDFWRLLSLSTIGGLITSTFFVLTFIPVLYFFLSKKKR